MSELERRALLGDRQAQEECTRQWIVLPCPFCGSEDDVFFTGSVYGCAKCEFIFSMMASEKSEALLKWNTRPAPPIGRCKDCKHQGSGDSDICHSGMDDEF